MPSESSHSHSRRSRSRKSRRTLRESRSRTPLTLLAVDAGLAAALLGVPLAMGGRLAIGQLFLVVSVCWSALAWVIHQTVQSEGRWKPTRVEPLLLAGIALVALQLVPVPTSWIDTISPQVAEILPLWGSGENATSILGQWSQLSFAPSATRAGLVTLCAYALLFVVVTQRIRQMSDIERLLRAIGIAAGLMALFALVQWATSDRKFFWFYEYPYTTNWVVQGSFTNRNHFAQFLALGIGPLIWWAVRAVRHSETETSTGFGGPSVPLGGRILTIGLPAIAIGAVAFACLVSLSRGGTLAMFIAALCTLVILFRKRLISGTLLAGMGGVATLVVACLMIYGMNAVTSRLDDWEAKARLQIWEANVEMVSDFPILGTGVGSHVWAYKMYLDQPFDEQEFTHAENSYLQVASESGLTGLALALMGVGFCAYWCIRGTLRTDSGRTGAAFAAISGALAAHFVHACFDFLWYVPGVMVVVVMLAAAACRLYQFGQESEIAGDTTAAVGSRRFPRIVWLTAAAGIGCLGFWMIQQRLPALAAEPHWHSYLRLSLAQKENDLDEDREDNDQSTFRRKLKYLLTAAKANPDDARIRLRMALAYRSLFHVLQRHSDNPMTLDQIRDAAVASQFESHEALMKWLDRALGKNRKLLDAALNETRHALQLCPLQGVGYLYLAELAFLHPSSATNDPSQAGDPSSGEAGLPVDQRCLQQALVVRPFDAQVLYAAGRQAWTEGDTENGLAYWKQAFHRSVRYQERIVGLLVEVVPATYLVENFDPDWDALRRIRERLKDLDQPEDYAVILRAFAKESVHRAENEDLDQSMIAWLYAHAQRAYDELGDHETAERCLQASLTADANSYDARFAIATWFYEQERFAEAVEHLEWCVRRNPQNMNLQSMLKVSAKEQHRNIPERIATRP